MKKMKVYLSLPISNYDEQERRQYAARTSGTLVWLHEDWDVVNPFHIASHVRKLKLDRGEWDEPSWEECMLHDIVALSECEKAVFCPGWERSEGCREEYQECLRLGIEIGYWDEQTETVLWSSRFNEEGKDKEPIVEDYLGLNW